MQITSGNSSRHTGARPLRNRWSHFASSSPIRQDERSADRIPLSTIARTVSGGQISHKITGDEDSGPPEPPRGNIFNVRAARERHAVETGAARRRGCDGNLRSWKVVT